MCGIAGVIDLAGRSAAPPGTLRRMADAIAHRGPDDDGYLDLPHLGLANRRLSIVGLADGKQPIANEDRSVWCVFNGEFFEYPEKRGKLEAKGHRFRTHTDTELLPHLWEDHGEGLFDHLKGQFAFCVWDTRRNVLVLARDRFGICPLYWTVRRQRGMTSCCSPRRSRPCSPPGWSRPSRTCTASTTCSRSSPCRDRRRASAA